MTQNSINNTASSLDVDSLHLDGNTISTTVTDDSLVLSPNGTGAVSLNTNFVSQIVFETGVNVKYRIHNTDNTPAAGSSAHIEVQTRPEPDGMAYFSSTISSDRSYAWGVDDVDKNMKINTDISASNVQTGTNLWTMTPAGERTMPLQPAFLGILNTTDNNVTGNNTLFTVGSGNPFTEIFDQNNDFTVTGTFTAPITGRYFLEFASRLDEPTVGTDLRVQITASNRVYGKRADPSTGELHLISEISTIANMDAADTAIYTIQLSGLGANTASLIGGQTRVSGALIC